tara:strand:- start:6964 stop:7170 length:207 start_codon:yes stop_codon:yes gene_type:complete
LFEEFKVLAEEKKEIFDEDIITLIQNNKLQDKTLNIYRLDKIKCIFESHAIPVAEVHTFSPQPFKSRD